MNTYLIDTDWSIRVLAGDPDTVQQTLTLTPAGLAMSAVNYAELYHGAYHTKRDQTVALAQLARYVDGIDVLPVTKEVGELFGVIRGGLPPETARHIGNMDLLIAATALAYDLVLVTWNVKHFRSIPDLKLYAGTEESEAAA